MIVNIPIVKNKTFNNETGQVTIVKGEMKVNIDTSFLAHLKWEEQFQQILQCDLTEYTQRVIGWTKNESTAKQNFLGILKLLYCYINSEELPTFKDFCKLFEYEVAGEILEVVGKVLTEIQKSMVNEKNY